ncbi:TPA: DNA methyltransferase [Bacillus paranthracis]|uniref:DNA methyltransferase n=1 Tax=Bacillus sp. ME5 TaxID=2744251 RepID=UPI00065B6347|nr:DNA methyltransferase [Bacillus sp. ME5]
MDALKANKLEYLHEQFEKKAVTFMDELPFRKEPYSGRNWGHPWHSLCSYHGKLKPAIAYHLIKSFTEKGQVVLDPMSGVGTIPFEASLQGRIGIGNDLNEMAYCVTRAKLVTANKDKVYKLLDELNTFIELFKVNHQEDYVPYADFGFNGKLPEYFHRETYSEIIAARQFFLDKKTNLSTEETLVFSCFLHVLHGNRPYALSRNSHPLTPYAPTGEYIYKNVVSHIKNKVDLSYKKGDWENFVDGAAILGDLFTLEEKILEKVDAIITSPPFFDSIRFYTSNWMRLWLAGWEPEDFKEADEKFLEGKQKRDLSVYKDFFEICSNLLKDKGIMILHLGKSKKCDMAKELSLLSNEYFQTVHIGNENVEQLEKHGIKDKGSTTEHQFLFLLKR